MPVQWVNSRVVPSVGSIGSLAPTRSHSLPLVRRAGFVYVAPAPARSIPAGDVSDVPEYSKCDSRVMLRHESIDLFVSASWCVSAFLKIWTLPPASLLSTTTAAWVTNESGAPRRRRYGIKPRLAEAFLVCGKFESRVRPPSSLGHVHATEKTRHTARRPRASRSTQANAILAATLRETSRLS
jgi:hypothetical protein